MLQERSRKQIETRRLFLCWLCTVPLCLYITDVSWIFINGLHEILIIWGPFIVLFSAFLISGTMPEGFLTRPLVQVFSARRHSLITWGVVYCFTVMSIFPAIPLTGSLISARLCEYLDAPFCLMVAWDLVVK